MGILVTPCVNILNVFHSSMVTLSVVSLDTFPVALLGNDTHHQVHRVYISFCVVIVVDD
jgi:hypothetical protein